MKPYFYFSRNLSRKRSIFSMRSISSNQSSQKSVKSHHIRISIPAKNNLTNFLNNKNLLVKGIGKPLSPRLRKIQQQYYITGKNLKGIYTPTQVSSSKKSQFQKQYGFPLIKIKSSSHMPRISSFNPKQSTNKKKQQMLYTFGK